MGLDITNGDITNGAGESQMQCHNGVAGTMIWIILSRLCATHVPVQTYSAAHINTQARGQGRAINRTSQFCRVQICRLEALTYLEPQ